MISCEARRLAAKAWSTLKGLETEFGRDEAMALFADLRSVDDNYYRYNICKLLFQRGDGEFASFADCNFGPTQFLVAQGYRWGKGVAPDLDLARQHYAMGFRLGNIPCFLALFSMLSLSAKLGNIAAMLLRSVEFIYLKSKSEDDTRILY